MPVEIVRVPSERVEAFYREREREALRSFYDFSVVWHEQVHAFAALENERVGAAATVRIAASLCAIERVVVDPAARRCGTGRALLAAAEEVANYYNCHKMTVLVPHQSGAQAFFEACDYHLEAVLPQHTFKLDMAVLRKFLL